MFAFQKNEQMFFLNLGDAFDLRARVYKSVIESGGEGRGNSLTGRFLNIPDGQNSY